MTNNKEDTKEINLIIKNLRKWILGFNIIMFIFLLISILFFLYNVKDSIYLTGITLLIIIIFNYCILRDFKEDFLK
jgi:inner membrane protein involved in colicin E2 resistance